MFGLFEHVSVHLYKQTQTQMFSPTKTGQDMKKEFERQRRSVKLSKDEHREFKRVVKEFETKIDAAKHFGFSVVTLDNVLLKGSGKPRTIEVIKSKIDHQSAA